MSPRGARVRLRRPALVFLPVRDRWEDVGRSLTQLVLGPKWFGTHAACGCASGTSNALTPPWLPGVTWRRFQWPGPDGHPAR